MDCFKTKLQLRGHHDGVDTLCEDLFDHLWFCRGCRAYAHYLWHLQATEAQSGVADSHTQEAWLERAWRQRARPSALPLAEVWRAAQGQLNNRH